MNDAIGILVVGFGIFLVIMAIAKTVWETIKCPHCSSGISRLAKVCKFCGRDV